MPELPEVETIVRDLRPELVGRCFLGARLSHDDVLRGVARRTLIEGLKGRRVRAVSRRAKHAVIDTDGRRLVIQPGMTGSLLILDRELTKEEQRYAVLRVALDDGRTLVYRDVRRLGHGKRGRFGQLSARERQRHRPDVVQPGRQRDAKLRGGQS